MLHVLTTSDQSDTQVVLAGMFAARKRVFVDLLKWNVPVIDGRYEVDEFDDDRATYLVLTDGDRQHLGSARILPTLGPHILATVFPMLCVGAPPAADDIAEITRFCLDPNQSARERRVVRDTLVHALVDHALMTGIRTYSAVAEMSWYQQIIGFGWQCRPLGPPLTIGTSALAALAIDIDAATPTALDHAGLRCHADLADLVRPVAA